jgi:hypothetical protein
MFICVSIFSGSMVTWELYTSCLLLLSLVLIEKILRGSLVLRIRRFTANVLGRLLGILLVHLLLSCYLFFMHSLLISGHINSKFFIFGFNLEFKVLLRLLIIVKEIKILNQKLSTRGSFLLLFLHKLLCSFIVGLVLIIIIHIVGIFFESHVVHVPIFVESI